MNDDEYCAYWDHYFELEFDGAPNPNLLDVLRVLDAVDEGNRLLAAEGI